MSPAGTESWMISWLRLIWCDASGLTSVWRVGVTTWPWRSVPGSRIVSCWGTHTWPARGARRRRPSLSFPSSQDSRSGYIRSWCSHLSVHIKCFSYMTPCGLMYSQKHHYRIFSSCVCVLREGCVWNLSTALVESWYSRIFTARSLKGESCACDFTDPSGFTKDLHYKV